MIVQPVLHPMLLLLLFVPVAVIVSIAFARARGAQRGLWALRILLILACFVLVLRPGIPGGTTQTLATDTDIVLVVDSTASIVAEDWAEGEPRLNGVREDIATIVARYPGARFALITFDASAQVRMPLTTDTTALMTTLTVLRPEVTAQSRGSSIGIAHSLLRQTLQGAAASQAERSRMVFYFGDGEQTASGDPESFERSAGYTDAGVVFGYGTAEGGPMRMTTGTLDSTDPGYIQYQGAPARSVIDETTLRTIGAQLGIPYQHRTAGTAPDLPDAPTSTLSASGSVGTPTELYWIAALAILVLLGIELARAAVLLARMRRLPVRGGET